MIEGSESIVPSVKEGRVTYPDVTKLIPPGSSAEVLDSLLAQGLDKRIPFIGDSLPFMRILITQG